MELLEQVHQMIKGFFQTNEMKAKLASLKSEIERKATNWWEYKEELEELVGQLEELSRVYPAFQKLKNELHSKYNLQGSSLKQKRARDNIDNIDSDDSDDSHWDRSSRQKIGQASNPYIVKIP